MTISSSPATPGLWLDTATSLTDATIAAVVAHGAVGVVRYVPLPSNGVGQDISADELGRICASCLELGLVQHVRYPGWDPAHHDGCADAVTAVQWAAHCGYPSGCHVWLDLEGISGTGPATAIYAANWAAHVLACGYLAGLYVGYSVPLTASELYELPGINSYWSDFGRRAVSKRGFALIQHSPEILVGGVKFDPDTMAADQLGELPMVCRA